MTVSGSGQAGALWYDLRAKQDQLSADLQRATGDLRTAGRVGEEAFATPMERATGRVREGVRGVVSEINSLRGKGPDELAQSFARAADSADEAFEAVRRIGTGDNLDTAKARQYADVLDQISIEAQQTLADLRELQAADPRFDTPEMQRAATELDRVGREASEGAAKLREIKGVGASTEFERLAHEANESAAGMDRAAGNTDGLLNKLKGVKGILVGLGLALSAQQLVSWAGSARDAFSELEQTTRTVDAVFGDSAQVIHDWGETAQTAAGLSKQRVNEAAAVMGQTLLNMGFNAREAAAQVVVLQQRAADMALAFGKTPEDAITAITAAMRGERDTIEKFGVAIKQADVNSRVLALGLDTSTSAAKKNAEAIAILDIILTQSEKSAGRFAESQDDVAVAMAQNQAKIDNFNAEVGRSVASIQLGAIKVGEAVTGVGEGVGEFFDDVFSQEKAAKVKVLAEAAGVAANEMRDRISAAAHDSNRTWSEQLDHMIAMTSGAGQELGNEAERTGLNIRRGFEDANIDDAISEPIRRGKEEALRQLNELYTGIAGVIAERENQLRAAGGDAVQAWLDPQIWQQQLEAVNAEITNADAVLAEQLRANAEAQRQAREAGDADALAAAKRTREELVREHETRTIELTAEAIQLQMNLATTGTAMEQAAALSSLRTSEFMREGLASKDPEIRALFEAWDAKLAETGARMESEAVSAAGATTQGLINGLERRTPRVHRSIYQLMNARPDTSWAFGTGQKVPIGIAAGISEEAWRVQSEMVGLSQVMRAPMVSSEPKDPRSGLRGITKAFGLVGILARGIRNDFPVAQGVMRDLSHILTPDMAGLAVPSMTPDAVLRAVPQLATPASGAPGSARNAGPAQHIERHVHIHAEQGYDILRNTDDTQRAAQRALWLEEGGWNG